MAVASYKVPAAGLIGAGAGMSVAEFISEFVARVTGQVKWAKVGVKGVVKGLLGVLFFFASTKLPGLWSLGMEISSYGAFGSIIPDVIFAVYPGGVVGLSETAAVSVRAMMAGAEVAGERMAEWERAKAAAERGEIPEITVK